MDNTSKDQMIGYAFALGALWDAVADDPDVPDEVRLGLQADARGLGQLLMTPREVAPGQSLDLVITDADGCLVGMHDLNPRELVTETDSIVLPENSTSQNSFAAAAALGVMRTLYHVAGDEALRSYYYDELLGSRGYTGLLTGGIAPLGAMYLDACVGNNCGTTNFSNVNMAFVALYPLLRYEGDTTMRSRYRDVLDMELWQPMRPITAKRMKQAFFSLLWAGFRHGGTDAAPVSDAAGQLSDFPTPPYFDPFVENCDAAEVSQGWCIGTDGETLLPLDPVPGWGGGVAALNPVPMSLRPPTNFEWRSDPRRVNGSGTPALNPGADFRVAYWLGRLLRQGADNDVDVSPVARMPDGSGGPHLKSDAGSDAEPSDAAADAGASQDGGDAFVDGAIAPGSDGGAAIDADAASLSDASIGPAAAGADGGATNGCGCRTGGEGGAWGVPYLIALIAARMRRSRRR